MAVFAAASPATAAPGDLARKFPVNDQNPTANLPTLEERNANPLEFGYLIQDLIARGEGAFVKKEWDRSVKYYEALAQLVPDRAIAFRKLCTGYAELGKIDIAAANCGKALTLGGARVLDHFRFVTLTLQKTALSPKEVADMEASIAHVRAHVAAHPTEAQAAPKAQAVDDLEKREGRAVVDLEEKSAEAKAPVSLPVEIEVVACKLSVRLRDERKIGACVDALRALKVDEKLVVSFEWARALVRKDADRSEELLGKARSLGLPQPALQAMVEEQHRSLADVGVRGFIKRWGLVSLLIVLVSAIATAAALRWTRTLKRRKLATAPQQG